jgi:hypothetical protein
VARFALDPQKTVFETATFQIRLELSSNVRRQWASGHFPGREKRRIVLLNEPIEPRTA